MTELSKETRSFIVKSIQDILAHDAQIILFGSYARGSHTPKSDIDIAIKSSGPLDSGKWSLIEEIFEESDLTQKVDIVDYHRVKPDFREVIDLEGIVISG